MLVSPFTFYRGAAGDRWRADLRRDARGLGSDVQLCGDAHLSNFGVFAAPDRRLVFDINDFDETLPGPFGVGREAACRELRGRRPRSRFREAERPRVVDRGGPGIPGGDAAAGRQSATSTSGTSRVDIEVIEQYRRYGEPKVVAQASNGSEWPRPKQGQPARHSPSSPRR